MGVAADSAGCRFPASDTPRYNAWRRSQDLRVSRVVAKRRWAQLENALWPSRPSHVAAALVLSLGVAFTQTTPCNACLWGAIATVAMVTGRQLVLFTLLHYKQWLLEIKPSTITKLWFMMVKVTSNTLFNWYSGSWLLPGMPSPPGLRQSVDKFVESMRPTLETEEFNRLKSISEEFVANEGPGLQRKLKLRAIFCRNWLADWWLDYGYLYPRTEGYRGFMNGIGPELAPFDNMFELAATSTHSTFTYFVDKLAVRDITPLSGPGGVPMDMFCLENLTGGCRHPVKSSVDDWTWAAPWRDSYIIVHVRGRYFKLYMHCTQGRVLAPRILSNLFKEMHAHASATPGETDPCVYTYLKRDDWAAKCSELRVSNEDTYQQVARAAFVLHFLEGPKTWQDALDSVGHTNQMLWCDKSLNLVVTSSGHVYICCEHSHCDAVLVSPLYCDLFLLYYKRYYRDGTIDDSKFPQNGDYLDYSELTWQLPPGLVAGYHDVVKEVQMNQNLNTRLCVTRVTVDKTLIKANKMGPDSFCQSVVFWAYYKKHRRIVNAYQPGTLMFFKRGRTENTRPVNQPKVDFVKAMVDDSVPVETKLSLLRKSANYQHEQTRLATIGQGCDRHLFGLYIVAKGTNTSSDFLDYVFNEGLDFPLCTSVAPMTMLPEAKQYSGDENADFCITGGQFRPFAPNQYAVVYLPLCQTQLNITITDLACSQETNSFELANEIESCFAEMEQLLRTHGVNQKDSKS